MSPALSSPENWVLCDPHELFSERAARVAPGDERAFMKSQMAAFISRADELEKASRQWYWETPPLATGGAEHLGDPTALATFVGERSSVYRAYAQALQAALELLTRAE